MVKCWQLCRKTCEKFWSKNLTKNRCGLFSNLLHHVFCALWSSGVRCNLGRALWKTPILLLCLFSPIACLVTHKYIFESKLKYILQNEQIYILHCYAHVHAWSARNILFQEGSFFSRGIKINSSREGNSVLSLMFCRQLVSCKRNICLLVQRFCTQRIHLLARLFKKGKMPGHHF